ncbi:MAG: Na+/H+ antiporter subunit E [Acidimicrobiia bacterium]
MTRHLLTVAWLTAGWVALWGGLSAANVLSGVAVAAVVLLAFPIRGARTVGLNPIGLVVLAAWFLSGLLRASIGVSWQVVRPRPQLRPGVIEVALPPLPRPLQVLVADAVSLTPGTLTLDLLAEPSALRIHLLDTGQADAVRRDVAALARLVCRAFPPVDRAAPADAAPSPHQELP